MCSYIENKKYIFLVKKQKNYNFFVKKQIRELSTNKDMMKIFMYL